MQARAERLEYARVCPEVSCGGQVRTVYVLYVHHALTRAWCDQPASNEIARDLSIDIDLVSLSLCSSYLVRLCNFCLSLDQVHDEVPRLFADLADT